MNWIIVFVVFLLSACSGKSTNKTLPTQLVDTQASAVTQVVQPRKLTKGEALYLRNCADCHGWEGRGNGPAAEYIDVATPVLQNSQLLNNQSEQQFVDWVLNPTSKLQVTDKAGPQTNTEASALLAYLRKQPGINWAQTEAGQETYDQLCANCHGLYGHGDGSFSAEMPVPMPDLSTASYQNQYNDQELLSFISQGKGAMPGFDEVLSAQEIREVLAFVRLLSPGYESYDKYCTTCHGADGAPVQLLEINEGEGTESEFIDISIPTLDAKYLNAHTDAQLIPKIQHMLKQNQVSMLHFSGDIKPDEATQIFRYLRDVMIND
ncbi:hypothetical protein AU255_12210 [Methyloprofundus sedimenti]|uniref:Cytochrome c domain-containing protein n=1 Tax=Methyloprofundus sedimenti TaxID=1420851 RepID=A0A1V8MAB5_9GAMM|nr:c-type cytochrome [Methyloprofundus sedimenti]OQK18540.1 hypothetical protein AU255_12210 [Methyloprofundus sedimenti]